MKPQRATLTPEIRIIDAQRGLVDYVASDESLDCYREIIRASGWKFDIFARNPVFVDSHNYWSTESMLGRIIDYKVQGGQLVERAQWAIDVDKDVAPLIHLGWQLTVNGYLKAVSVGFFPTRFASKWDADQTSFLAQVADLKLTPEQAATLGTVYIEQQQIELSACVIGANPNALAKAHTDGAVKDADLARCGFADEDMAFLHKAARAYDGSASFMRTMLDTELSNIPFRKEKTKTQTASATTKPGTVAPEATTRRGAEDFLRKFEQAIK